MTTVIDALLVTIGLNPAGFKKGSDEVERQSKKTKDAVKKDGAEVAGSTAKTEFAVKKSADSMVSSFRRVATEVIGLFIAVRSVQDVVGFFERVNAGTRQLGLDSKNFGIAANELKNWQNIAELAGGSAADATQTIANLNRSIFQLHYTGQMSDQLRFLQRLGVQYETTGGRAASFRSIVEQTARIIEKNGRPRQENFQYLQAAGFDEGITNAILEGSAAVDKYLKTVEKLPQYNEADAKSAQHLAQAWDFLKDKVTVGAQKFLTALDQSGFFDKIFTSLSHFVDYLNDHQKDISDWFSNTLTWLQGDGGVQIKGFFTDLATVVKLLAEAIRYLVQAWKELAGEVSPSDLIGVSPLGGPWKAAKFLWDHARNRVDAGKYQPAMTAAEEKYDLPSGLLARVAKQESGFDPSAVSTKDGRVLARGIMQLNPQFFPNAGKDVDADIDAGAEQLATLYKKYGNWQDAVAAYNAGPGTWDKVLAGSRTAQSAANAAQTRAYVANVLGAYGSSATRQASTPSASSASIDSSPTLTAPASIFIPNPNASILAPNPSALSAAQGAQPSPAVQANSPPIASNVDHSTQVQIGQMTVNTAAQDADSMAQQAWRAVQRKFAVAYNEPGLA